MLDYPEEATGHTVFAEGTRSPCPWHNRLCAYTGKEHDRCSGCHMLWEKITSCHCTECCGDRKLHEERHLKLWTRTEKKRLRILLHRTNIASGQLS